MKSKNLNGLKILGARIQKSRKKNGLTQEDMADRMGCSLTYISKLENGKATFNMDRLFQIGNALECDVGELLSGTNKESPHYLESEWETMFKQLSAEDKELICAFMQTMLKRREKDAADYAIP